jgi:hypothetical protein
VVDDGVAGGSEHPRGHALLPPEPGQAAMNLEEDLLDDVLDVRARAHAASDVGAEAAVERAPDRLRF